MLVEQIAMDAPVDATAVVTAGTTNVAGVVLTIRDAAGRPVPGAVFDLLLSDSAAGVGLTATSASGTVVNDGTNGADLGTLTAKKALRVQAGSTGKYGVNITDTAKTAFKVVAMLNGRPKVVATLATASYG